MIYTVACQTTTFASRETGITIMHRRHVSDAGTARRSETRAPAARVRGGGKKVKTEKRKRKTNKKNFNGGTRRSSHVLALRVTSCFSVADPKRGDGVNTSIRPRFGHNMSVGTVVSITLLNATEFRIGRISILLPPPSASNDS